MEFLWLFLILMTMVVYSVFLVRSALKGKRWAQETLEAMRYVGGDLTASAWRPPPPQPGPPTPAAQDREPSGGDGEAEPGRLVA